MTFDIFCISSSLVVPSIDHVSVNKVLTNTKSHECFCKVISSKIEKKILRNTVTEDSLRVSNF